MAYNTVMKNLRGIKKMLLSEIPDTLKNLLTPVAIVASLGFTGYQYTAASIKSGVDDRTAQITLNVQTTLGAKFDKIDGRLDKMNDKIDVLLTNQLK